MKTPCFVKYFFDVIFFLENWGSEACDELKHAKTVFIEFFLYNRVAADFQAQGAN